MKQVVTSRKDERKHHKWDSRVKGKVARKLSSVTALKTPEIWLDNKPVANKHVSAFKVEWKPFEAKYEWVRKIGRGKIHAWFKIGGHNVHIVLDDAYPIGILHCEVDRRDLLGLGNCFVRESDGTVFMQMKLWDRTKRRRDRVHREMVVSAFKIGWDNV